MANPANDVTPGASGDDYAYAIPAWHIFNRDYYARLPRDGPIFPVAA